MSLKANDPETGGLRPEKRAVRSFYEEIGWQRGSGTHFADTLKFEDLRPVSQEYIHKSHLRVNRYLNQPGKLLADLGSGPVTHPEYLTYSQEYDRRLCIDFSFAALREARDKLGNKGIYVVADITNLPLKDMVVDGVVSLHTIYHVPADEQDKAFNEIWRILQPGSPAVIVYHWGDRSLLMNAALWPFHLYRLVRKAARSMRKRVAGEANSSVPQLYFHSHSYGWITEQLREMNFDIVSWRSVSVEFLKFFIHSQIFGREILRIAFWLEDRFPYFMGRFGQYPMIVIDK